MREPSTSAPTMAHEPLSNGRRLMAIPGVFYGGGCSYMACRGLMMSGISDVLLITHGPVGCAYYSGVDAYSGKPSELPAHAAHVFTTNMDQTDIIFGGERKLDAAIDEAVEMYHPRAIAICATCPVGLIGDDIEQIASNASQRHGIDVLPLSCEGFKSQPGWLHAGKQILSQWVGLDSRPTGRFPIHFMSESSKHQPTSTDLLKRLGYDVVCSLMGATTYSDIRRSQDAKLIVLDSGKAIDEVPLLYRKRYGTGFMRIGLTGLGNIKKSLRAMADFFADDQLSQSTEAVIACETARIAPRLQQARDEFAGMTAAVFEDIFRSNDYATLSVELGMNIIMIAPDYSKEAYSDEGFAVHVPASLDSLGSVYDALRIDLDAAPVTSSLPGCENAESPVRDMRWHRLTLSRAEVSDLLRAVQPDLCFAGVETRFGDLRCRMRNNRFLSDERGCNYSGFDGFERYARDLSIARDLTPLATQVPAWYAPHHASAARSSGHTTRSAASYSQDGHVRPSSADHPDDALEEGGDA